MLVDRNGQSQENNILNYKLWFYIQSYAILLDLMGRTRMNVSNITELVDSAKVQGCIRRSYSNHSFFIITKSSPSRNALREKITTSFLWMFWINFGQCAFDSDCARVPLLLTAIIPSCYYQFHIQLACTMLVENKFNAFIFLAAENARNSRGKNK